MNQESWAAVERHITEVFALEDPALHAALDASAQAGLPPINVTPNQGKLLSLLARMQKARAILEIGTLGGYSTIWLARGLSSGGRVVTLEIEPKHAKVALANIARAGLSDVVDLRLGPAIESLARLAADRHAPFDLVFIDADKSSYADYLEWSLRLSRPGTLIVADNVVRGGRVIDADSNDPRVQGVRRFNERVAGNRRLSATIIQTVSSKGYDGFTLAVVDADD